MSNDKKTERAVLFLGSGATAGSGIKKHESEDLPPDSGFFGALPRLIEKWENAYPALKIFRDRMIAEEESLYKTWNDLFIYRNLASSGIVRENQETLTRFKNLENHKWPDGYEWRAQHYQSQFRLKSQSSLPDEYFMAELGIWDLRTLIKEVYEETSNSECAYEDFLKAVENDILKIDEVENAKISAVVNLNYDTTFDDALNNEWHSSEKKIHIIRPHGSLKWTSQATWNLGTGWGRWTELEENTKLEQMGYRPTGNSNQLDFRQPLIVSPVYFKEEVIGNSSMPGLQNAILKREWRKLSETLVDSTHWLFIGISFTSGDDHLLWLLKHFYSKNKPKISCFIYQQKGKKDNYCQPVRKLKECLGNINICVYKNKNEQIHEFEELSNFKECVIPDCNH